MSLEDIAGSLKIVQALDNAFDVLSENHVLYGRLMIGSKSDKYVLPFLAEGGAFQDEAMAFLEKELRELGPRRTVHKGYLALEVQSGGERPTSITYNTGTRITFEFKVERGEPKPRKMIIPVEETETAYEILGKAGGTIECRVTPSSIKYQLIVVNGNNRQFFPWYRVPFLMQNGDQQFTTWVASAKKDTPTGALAGNYIKVGVSQIYQSHPGIDSASQILLTIVEPGKVYKYEGCR